MQDIFYGFDKQKSESSNKETLKTSAIRSIIQEEREKMKEELGL